jgi:hypothetical protein
MSHGHHESDRAAAYRGLILGAIIVAIVVVSIVKMTNAKYAGEKTGSANRAVSGITLDV